MLQYCWLCNNLHLACKNLLPAISESSPCRNTFNTPLELYWSIFLLAKPRLNSIKANIHYCTKHKRVCSQFLLEKTLHKNVIKLLWNIQTTVIQTINEHTYKKANSIKIHFLSKIHTLSYYTHYGYPTSIFGKNWAYYIQIFTVRNVQQPTSLWV